MHLSKKYCSFLLGVCARLWKINSFNMCVCVCVLGPWHSQQWKMSNEALSGDGDWQLRQNQHNMVHKKSQNIHASSASKSC